MKYCLSEDASPNCPNAAERTLLNFAITSSCKEVARLLDHRAVNPNMAEVNQTRIAWAQLVSLLPTDGATPSHRL